MLFAAILITIALTVCFALLPGRLLHRAGRGVTQKDICAALLPALAAWGWAACVYAKPGLNVGFDGFRLLAVCGSVVWLSAVVLGLRLRHLLAPKARRPALVVLLAVAALGVEVFVCNLNFFATHSYQPIDLRGYLVDAPEGEPLTLNEENDTLSFPVGQPLYNLKLVGLEYQYDGPHADAQDPLFTLTVGATDEGTSAVRQTWPWQVALRSEASMIRSLDLTGEVNTLTLTAAAYRGEYRQHPLSYTLQTVLANVTRPLRFSVLRWLLLFAAACGGYALRPASSLWQKNYLQMQKASRPLVFVCAGALCALAFLAPFADRFSVGVATSFYNTPSWDGVSRITFTKHLNEEQADTAGQYGALAHSLLNGRLDLPLTPPDGLTALENPYDTAARAAAAPDALWDVAYYNGRYYVYFGLIPCLLFQLPFEALTGVGDLPPSLPMILMACLGILAAFGAVGQTVRRWFPGASVAAYLVAASAVAGGGQVYYLLLRPSVYEYAILCGASFVMLALWQWLAAANTPVARRKTMLAHLALGSLCMALVAGCRPQMEYFALLALPIFWPRYLREKRLLTRQGGGEATAFLLPVVAVAALLLWYNAARFGSPLDFGANYNLTSNDMTARGFSVGRTAPALFTTFFAPAAWNSVFPYLSATKMATNYMGITITELYYGGVFACLPFLWGLAVLPLGRERLSAKKDLRAFVAVILAGAVLLAVLDCQMAGVLYRYQSDFLPPLLLAAALAWLLAEQVLQAHADFVGTDKLCRLLRTSLPVSAVACAVYQFCVFFAAEPGLVGQSPALYQNVSRAIQFWL